MKYNEILQDWDCRNNLDHWEDYKKRLNNVVQ